MQKQKGTEELAAQNLGVIIKTYYDGGHIALSSTTDPSHTTPMCWVKVEEHCQRK